MLKIVKSVGGLSYSGLMLLYTEENEKTAAEYWPDLSQQEGLLLAEQEFFQYLKQVFFTQKDAFYAVWEQDGVYKSALRLEPYKDGYLLSGLITGAYDRKKGYASALIRSVLACLPRELNVYSHVDRKNTPSLKTHFRCGFRILSDTARTVDGSLDPTKYTLLFRQ